MYFDILDENTIYEINIILQSRIILIALEDYNYIFLFFFPSLNNKL
jgi:hypothetical protein